MTRIRAWSRVAGTAGLIIGLDQASKALATSSIGRSESINIFFGLDLSNVRNRGVAFGALSDKGGLLIVLAAIAITVLLVHFARNRTRPWLWLPTGAILGGAIGNLVDRVRIGAVVDFIDPAYWPAFNFADMAIVIGVGAILYLAEPGPGDSRTAE